MRKEIEQRFSTEAKLLPELQERFNAEVVRRAYSTTEIVSYENVMMCRGSDFDGFSEVLCSFEDASYACGFDRADRPVVLQGFDTQPVAGPRDFVNSASQSVPTKELWLEEFITYLPADVVDFARFVRGELHAIHRLTFRDRLEIEEECFRDGCYQHSRFQYEHRRIILQQSIAERGHVFFEIAFGPHGEQSYFRVRPDGTRFQLAHPLPK